MLQPLVAATNAKCNGAGAVAVAVVVAVVLVALSYKLVLASCWIGAPALSSCPSTVLSYNNVLWRMLQS